MVSSLCELTDVKYNPLDESVSIQAETINFHVTALLAPDQPVTFTLKMRGNIILKGNDVDLSNCQCSQVMDSDNNSVSWRSIPSHWLDNTGEDTNHSTASTSSVKTRSKDSRATKAIMLNVASQKMPSLLLEAIGKMATNLQAYKKLDKAFAKEADSPYRPFYAKKSKLKRKRLLYQEEIESASLIKNPFK